MRKQSFMTTKKACVGRMIVFTEQHKADAKDESCNTKTKVDYCRAKLGRGSTCREERRKAEHVASEIQFLCDGGNPAPAVWASHCGEITPHLTQLSSAISSPISLLSDR